MKELASLTEGSSLNSVEILLDDFEKRDGEYTVVINGTGISPETRVSLLGNINTGSYFRCEESGSYGEYYSILYAIETLNPKHPYVWACALIFALSLLSSYVFHISYEAAVSYTHLGFLFPAYTDGGADLNHVAVFQKDADRPHQELVRSILRVK